MKWKRVTQEIPKGHLVFRIDGFMINERTGHRYTRATALRALRAGITVEYIFRHEIDLNTPA